MVNVFSYSVIKCSNKEDVWKGGFHAQIKKNT